MRMRLIAMAVLALAAAIAFVAFDPDEPGPAPQRLRELGPWLEQHPSDWIASSIVVDKALDSPLPQRDPLWRAAYAHSQLLAPYREAPHLAFLRSGLGHWYELGEPDRQRVRENAASLLVDPDQFRKLWRAVWEVTGDYALLRRANPGTAESMPALMWISSTYGLFPEYREARGEFRRRQFAEFGAARAMMPQPEIANVLPDAPVRDDEPLLQAALDEWHRRPLDSLPVRSVAGTIEYSLRHGLRPLDGLDYLITHPYQGDPLRARLAIYNGFFDRATDLEISSSDVTPLAWRQYHVERAYAEAKRGELQATNVELFKASRAELDAEVLEAAAKLQKSDAAVAELTLTYSMPAKWEGLCSADVCQSARAQWYTPGAAQQTLALSTVQTDEYAPYAEVYVDEELASEGPVAEATPFAIAAKGEGVHRVEIRLANPLTRNLLQRRVRIAQ